MSLVKENRKFAQSSQMWEPITWVISTHLWFKYCHFFYLASKWMFDVQTNARSMPSRCPPEDGQNSVKLVAWKWTSSNWTRRLQVNFLHRFIDFQVDKLTLKSMAYCSTMFRFPWRTPLNGGKDKLQKKGTFEQWLTGKNRTRQTIEETITATFKYRYTKYNVHSCMLKISFSWN